MYATKVNAAFHHFFSLSSHFLSGALSSFFGAARNVARFQRENLGGNKSNTLYFFVALVPRVHFTPPTPLLETSSNLYVTIILIIFWEISSFVSMLSNSSLIGQRERIFVAEGLDALPIQNFFFVGDIPQIMIRSLHDRCSDRYYCGCRRCANRPRDLYTAHWWTIRLWCLFTRSLSMYNYKILI